MVRKKKISQGCPILPLSFNMELEVLANAVKPKKKEKIEAIDMFIDVMIIYVENHKRINKNSTETNK